MDRDNTWLIVGVVIFAGWYLLDQTAKTVTTASRRVSGSLNNATNVGAQLATAGGSAVGSFLSHLWGGSSSSPPAHTAAASGSTAIIDRVDDEAADHASMLSDDEMFIDNDV